MFPRPDAAVTGGRELAVIVRIGRIPAKALVALAALVAVAPYGCAAIDPNDLITRRFSRNDEARESPMPALASAELGSQARLAAFDFVWSTVAQRYYDPAMNGVDWKAAGERWRPRVLAAPDDESFWTRLDRMTGELRDAHTRVISPKRAAQIARLESVGAGFALQPIEDQLVVTRVGSTSDAYWAGVRPGMKLLRVAGEGAPAAYARRLADMRESSTPRARRAAAARMLLAGEPDSLVELIFARSDGSTFTVFLKRQRFTHPPRTSHRVLPSGFGYLRLTDWAPSLQGEVIEAIEALRGTPGLVIDLRGNPGGSAMMVRDVAASFFQRDIEAGRALTRDGKPITLAFDWIEVVKIRQEIRGTGLYRAPVAVLVDGASASASELFAGILQSQARATIVGEATCGCVLAYMGYAQIPGGGQLAYSEVGFVLANGKRIEGEGIVPDVPVAITVADLLVERDRALEEAQSHLAAMGSGKTVAQGSDKILEVTTRLEH